MRRLIYLLMSTVVLGAQAPGDTKVFSVAYVNIMPSSKATAVAAFKQYRDTSRKDEGYVRSEFLEQIGRPGHFAVVETWASQTAFDAHQMAAHRKQLLSQLEPIRTSDYDQRLYKTLTLGTASAAASDSAIHVLTHVDIGGQGTNAPDLLKQLADTSRKDEGNLRFDVLQQIMRLNHFTVVETWQNQKAYDAHVAAAQTKQHRDVLGPKTGSPVDERVYKAIQ